MSIRSRQLTRPFSSSVATVGAFPLVTVHIEQGDAEIWGHEVV